MHESEKRRHFFIITCINEIFFTLSHCTIVFFHTQHDNNPTQEARIINPHNTTAVLIRHGHLHQLLKFQIASGGLIAFFQAEISRNPTQL